MPVHVHISIFIKFIISFKHLRALTKTNNNKLIGMVIRLKKIDIKNKNYSVRENTGIFIIIFFFL